MSKKIFTIFWFSPKNRKFIRPHVYFEVGAGRRLSRANFEKGRNSTLPDWATKFASRRALAASLGLILIAIWTLAFTSINLSWLEYSLMGTAVIINLAFLNFTFRSIFDSLDEDLDERLISLRNRYSFPAYQIIGLLLIVVVGALDFASLDASRLWLPAFASYASIPYLLLGWQEKNFE